MLTFLVFTRHAPADCAVHNEASRKTLIEWYRKTKELEAKHGVNMVGGWNVHSEHLTVQVFEAPNFEAFQAYSREPEVMNKLNWSTSEVKVAMTLEETSQMMRQRKQT